METGLTLLNHKPPPPPVNLGNLNIIPLVPSKNNMVTNGTLFIMS